MVKILASLLTVTYAALLILAVIFYSWQKKQGKGKLLSNLYFYVYTYGYIVVIQFFRSQ